MSIVETYRRLHPGSAACYARATQIFPSGVTHDSRYIAPFPLYIERSAGAHKWDVDGNRLIDYWTGHGALLLGHSHPTVVAAVQAQMARGTHYGAEHELGIRWAALVQQLFPSIERLRFTASGTEATMLALRLARAYTGRPVVVRLTGHYHGWHDALTYDTGHIPPGLYSGLRESTIRLSGLALLEAVLDQRDDIAAVILEPTGSSYGTEPLGVEGLCELHRMTKARNVLVIYDEVVTGFRVAPGGAQARAGIAPDLTALAKILAGGLPGGAIGGRADIMEHLAFGDTTWNNTQKILHKGTFNANPLSAAAGIATLEQVATGDPGTLAASLCTRLIEDLNSLFRERDLRGWAAYGDSSIFHIVAASMERFTPGVFTPFLPFNELRVGGNSQVLALLRLALNSHGVDLMRGRSGFLSTAHTLEDIAATVAAFAAALDDLESEGVKP